MQYVQRKLQRSVTEIAQVAERAPERVDGSHTSKASWTAERPGRLSGRLGRPRPAEPAAAVTAASSSRSSSPADVGSREAGGKLAGARGPTTASVGKGRASTHARATAAVGTPSSQPAPPPAAARAVLPREPAAPQLAVLPATRKEASGLCRPREQRRLRSVVPARVGAQAPGPHGLEHLGEGELVRQHDGRRPALARGVRVEGLEALGRPVRDADRRGPARPHLGVDGVDELAHGHARIVAVQQVDVDVVRAQELEAAVELARDHLGPAIRRVRALSHEHDGVADPEPLEEPADRGLRLVAVVPGRVEARPAGRHERLPERRLDANRPHDEPGGAAGDPRDGHGLHGRAIVRRLARLRAALPPETPTGPLGPRRGRDGVVSSGCRRPVSSVIGAVLGVKPQPR